MGFLYTYMKIFRSESLVDYKTYTFNYATYCEKENLEELAKIYDLGFLPYSNDIRLKSDFYYLARSLRVELARFSDSSENRRVQRKVESLNPDLKHFSVGEFDVNDKDFKAFCLEYAQARFSEGITAERLDYILNHSSLSHVFQFELEGKLAGYVISVEQGGSLHYWFSFYAMEFSTYSVGKWMMHSVIAWAKNAGYEKVYLGTCYGNKSLYKVRDFKGLSFFDGNQWSQDMKVLKEKCKSDDQFSLDDFKRFGAQSF